MSMDEKPISERIREAAKDVETPLTASSFDVQSTCGSQLEVTVKPTTELEGYGKSSDNTANVHCGDCEERLEMVVQDGIVKGFICGCKETPDRFVIDPM